MEIKLYDRLQDYKESNSTTLKEIFDEAIKDFLDKKILEERKAKYNATISALKNANKPVWGKEFTIALTSG